MTETKPMDRMTSAEIKKQIEEASRVDKAKIELKDSGLPIVGQIANEINATAVSTPEPVQKAESKPEPVKAAAEQKPTSPNVDLNEWAKKKGIDWTTDESILSALHKSDQEFHRKRAEQKAKEASNGQPNGYGPVYTPNTYPPAGYAQPPVGFAPSYPQVVGSPNVVSELGRYYNMLPEDVERLARFNRDWFESAKVQMQREFDDRLRNVQIENQKNSVFRDLSSDPIFRRPEVGAEYHKVLEDMQASDPQSFEQDPNAYRRAYDKALVNIARRNLEGKPLQEGVPPTPTSITPPTTPPRPLGQGSGGGSLEKESTITNEQFARMSLEEKKEVIEKMGLRAPY